MASLNYLSMLDDTFRGAIDFDTDTFKGMLVTDVYVPNATAHTKRSDVTNEVTGAGYTAGGFPVTVTVTKNAANNRLELAFSSSPLSNATITARGVVVYKSRGGAASADELASYIDFGENVASTNGTFTVNYTTPLYINNNA